MFLIAGIKGETTTANTGEFYCPECNCIRMGSHKQVHEKATVFFISVVNLRFLGEYIECQSCSSTYKMEVLNYDPEKEHEKIDAMYLLGIKKVMTMMMLADGKIDDNEKRMMEDIYFRMADSELQDIEIENEIEYCNAHPFKLEEFLKELFPQLNDSGRETIIKVAYWVSISDGDIDSEEEKLLMKLAKIFQISSAHLKGIIAEVNEITSE